MHSCFIGACSARLVIFGLVLITDSGDTHMRSQFAISRAPIQPSIVKDTLGFDLLLLFFSVCICISRRVAPFKERKR